MGKGMQDDFIKTSRELRDYIREEHGGSVEESMVKNKEVILVEPAKSFSSREERDKELTSLNDQLDWEDQRKEYYRHKNLLKKELNEVAGLLLAHCHITMRNKLEADSDYKIARSSDAGEIYRIIKRISTGTDSVQNPTRNAVESMYSQLFIRGQDHSSLTEYYEQFEHRSENVESSGILYGSELLRDQVIAEYVSRGDSNCVACMLLSVWKKTEEYKPTTMTDLEWKDRDIAIMNGRWCLHNKILAMIFLKRSGNAYLPFKNEINNDYAKGSDSYAINVSDMFTQLDQWEPAYKTATYEKRTTGIAHLQDGTPEVPGDQHMQGSTQREFKGKCFKCDRKGHPSYKCTETTKEDGTP